MFFVAPRLISVYPVPEPPLQLTCVEERAKSEGAVLLVKREVDVQATDAGHLHRFVVHNMTFISHTGGEAIQSVIHIVAKWWKGRGRKSSGFHISLRFALKAGLPNAATPPSFLPTAFSFLVEKLMSCDCAPLWNKFSVGPLNGFALQCPRLLLAEGSSPGFSQPWYPRFHDEDVSEPQVLSCHSEFIDITTFFWVPADEWVTPDLGHRAQRDGYGWNLELVYVSTSCPSSPLKIYTYVCIFFLNVCTMGIW